MSSSHFLIFTLLALAPAYAHEAHNKTLPFPPAQQVAATTPLPDGLPKSDWQGIRAAHSGWKHRFEAAGDGWRARNPGQQWTSRFDGRGFLATPEQADWTWGLEFQNYGFGESLAKISGTANVRVEGQRLTYQWNDTVEEWFINDERGLEHGFIVKERPTGGKDGEPLAFVLATCGPLRPAVSTDARAVGFRDEDGTAVLHYSGLKVWDADGTVLPSRFESLEGNRFRLVVEESGARYPITIDPVAQQAYLKASNTDAGDVFGRSVAIDGDTVVVGANFEDSSTAGVNSTPDNSASRAGAVYVFVRHEGIWSQEAYIKASNPGVDDEFGFALALSGDTLVVGAPLEDSSTTGVNSTPNNDAFDSGAAYVFVRENGVWSQQAYFKASNPDSSDLFGRAVAVSGDTVVIGAHEEDSDTTGVNSTPNNNASNSGAAYVFIRNGVAWSQQAYLKASNAGSLDQFGRSVAISGDTLAVGAIGEDTIASTSGAAYVFVREGTAWTEEAFLKASNAEAVDEFGWSLSVSENTLLVSAPGEDSSTTGVNGNPNNDASNSGAAYVFLRSGTTWSQQAYLKASNPGAGDTFGWHVALSGDTAVVGAMREDSSTAGVNSTPNNSASNSGAVYVFARNGIAWSQQAYLKASNPGAEDRFGGSVGVSGDTVVGGAFGEGSNTTGVNSTPNDAAFEAGAVYIFVLSPDPPPPPPARVSVKGNKKRLTTRRPRIVLRGTAIFATRVQFKAGKGRYKAARGVARWSAPIRLKKKRTLALVRASGPGGSSPILRVFITRKTPRPR